MAHSPKIIFFALQIGLAVALFKFQNLDCTIKDKSLGHFTACRIKALNRNRNLINLSFHLNMDLEKDVTIGFQFYKRENGGWHPFLYGMKVDVCNFLDGRKRNPLTSIIYFYLERFTNVNHSCPFLVNITLSNTLRLSPISPTGQANTEIKLANMKLEEYDFIKKFPLEDGLYALHTLWYLKKDFIASVNCSANLVKTFKRQ